ncbi:MAG: hypothetical protein K2F89_00230, partial [Treponemataceae bacterium]|nr:hypothetical protein [Treponemataceae bacterium]
FIPFRTLFLAKDLDIFLISRTTSSIKFPQIIKKTLPKISDNSNFKIMDSPRLKNESANCPINIPRRKRRGMKPSARIKTF